MKTVETAKITQNIRIAPSVFDMKIIAPDIAGQALAGQFVEIHLDNGENLLPRPISICDIENEEIRLVYRVVGKGTMLLSQKAINDTIRVLGPLGNGFELNENINNHLLIGGGIGVPPLLYLSKRLKGDVRVLLGFKDDVFLTEDFVKAGAKVSVATDDGSTGFKGNVVELLKETVQNIDCIYSCGPTIMLKALSEFACRNNIPAQVSMEQRMACGIGACVGCVIKIKNDGGFCYKKVCSDGPVFDASEVVWSE